MTRVLPWLPGRRASAPRARRAVVTRVHLQSCSLVLLWFAKSLSCDGTAGRAARPLRYPARSPTSRGSSPVRSTSSTAARSRSESPSQPASSSRACPLRVDPHCNVLDLIVTELTVGGQRSDRLTTPGRTLAVLRPDPPHDAEQPPPGASAIRVVAVQRRQRLQEHLRSEISDQLRLRAAASEERAHTPHVRPVEDLELRRRTRFDRAPNSRGNRTNRMTNAAHTHYLAKTADVVTHATSGGPASHQATVPQRSKSSRATSVSAQASSSSKQVIGESCIRIDSGISGPAATASLRADTRALARDRVVSHLLGSGTRCEVRRRPRPLRAARRPRD